MKTLGAVFQRLMKKPLEELQPQFAGVYIDDITIYSLTQKQNLKDLDQVLKKLN